MQRLLIQCYVTAIVRMTRW